MSDMLSESEIDSLLTSLGGGGDSGGTTDNSDDYSAPSSSGGGQESRKKVKLYDFKRPEKFSKDHQRTLHNLHEQFARLNTTSMSAQLRILANFHVASVDQLTYEEFIRSIPSPSSLGIVVMDPLKGNAILEIDPGITFTIIDRVFGGSGSITKINRELTDIENKVMEFILSKMLVSLREAWANVIDLRPRLSQIESNPNFVQGISPNEMCIVITFETKLGEVEGLINLCLPFMTIEPIIQKLSSQYWYATGNKSNTRDTYNTIKNKLSQVFIDVIAEIGHIDISIRELINLEKGDTVKLRTNALSDITLRIGTKNKFYCKPGLVGKNVSVQITKPIEKIVEDIPEFDEYEEEEEEDFY